MIYTLEELQSYFSPDQIKQGLQELQNCPVLAPNIKRNGQLITAIIQHGGKPLRIYIQVKNDNRSDLTIKGECTCAAGQNCSHVVALLLKAVQQNTDPIEQHHSSDTQTTIQSSGTESYPADVQHRLLYILRLAGAQPQQLQVEPTSARLLSSNNYTDNRPYKPEWVLRGIPPRYLLSSDIDILKLLAHSTSNNKNILKGRAGGSLLKALLKTGRCYHDQIQNEAIQPGHTINATPSWVIDSAGNQTIQWQTTSDTVTIFYLDGLWYLDNSNNFCGHIECNLPDALITALATLPPTPPEKIEQITSDFAAQFPQAQIPAARQITVKQLPFIKPQPQLQLHNDNGTLQGDIASLTFRYHNLSLGTQQPPAQLTGNQLLRFERDHKTEKQCIKQLIELGFHIDNHRTHELGTTCFNLPGESNNWLQFQSQHLPELAELGWRIEINANFRHHLAEPDHWFTHAIPTGNGQFDVSIGIEAAGRQFNLLPSLSQLSQEFIEWHSHHEHYPLGDMHPIIIPLEDGYMLSLPFNRVRYLLDTLPELQDATLGSNETLQLNRFQLTRLAELDEAPDATQKLQWLGNTECQQLAEQLRQLDQIPVITPPTGLKAELRPYQQEGLNWLQFLREYDLAGILADDMGLGKTLQILAHLLIEKEHGRANHPSLIIIPTSLISNWHKEVERFTPTLSLLTLHGPQRHALFERIPQYDLVLTTYPLLLRDIEQLQQRPFHLLVLDEAQLVKNPKGKASQAVRLLQARHAICLTGTPMENHLGELWSLFDFCLPGLLGTERQFRNHSRNPIERHGDEEAANRLRRRIKPFLLRRTKEAVATELPPKTTILQNVALTGKQRELYETIRLTMYRQVRQEVDAKGLSGSRITILNALLRLRQVCCDPALLKLETAQQDQPSAKMQLLMEMLPEMIEEGRRILLFSQFTSMLDIIERATTQAGIQHVKLTGKTRDRATPIEQFQSGRVPLFLISLKAGGVGLNLTAADTIIHYDPWWNPAAENQASDRAHRIGQKNPVFIYKFICEETVEERIQTMQAHKQALADGLYEQKVTTGSQWTEEDLEYLLGAWQ